MKKLKKVVLAVLSAVLVVGNIKKDLRLSDRIYKCECGNVIDRDYQAALNLKRNAVEL